MPSSKAHAEHILAYGGLEGHWRHRVWDRAGRLVDPGQWKKNLIVRKVGDLLAWFLHGTGAQGIQYYALGSGLTSWDASPGSALVTDTQLQTEITDSLGSPVSRKVPIIEYLDSDGNVTLTKTRAIKLTAVYDYNDLNDPGPPNQTSWREFGVFGGDANSTSPNSGYMINHVVTGLFTKTALLRVERTVRFTF